MGAKVVDRLVVLLMLVAAACSGSPLNEVRVGDIDRAGEAAKSRAAYERARARSGKVETGMSTAAVEEAMGGVVANEGESGGGGRKATLIEGLLCKTDPTALRERWLFGYDEGGVVLIGFAVEFDRTDADDDDWKVRRVDQTPQDDCPDVRS